MEQLLTLSQSIGGVEVGLSPVRGKSRCFIDALGLPVKQGDVGGDVEVCLTAHLVVAHVCEALVFAFGLAKLFLAQCVFDSGDMVVERFRRVGPVERTPVVPVLDHLLRGRRSHLPTLYPICKVLCPRIILLKPVLPDRGRVPPLLRFN